MTAGLDYRSGVTEEAAAATVPAAGHGRDGMAGEPGPTPAAEGFQVHLGEVFEGPFDLLLSLIAKHKLDVTEVALAKVTDEFIAHIRARGPDWDLGQATEFLVVAATLLDLKAARLLPSGEVESEEDLALLEARDLLFARLLQYRAYKQVAAFLAARMAAERGRYVRSVTLEPQFAGLLPEVLLGLGPAEFAALAARALAPKPVAEVSMAHLHAAKVSVREQAAILVSALRRSRSSTFRALTADCEGTVYVVARFLALLELYREGAVLFEQVSPLGELHIRWAGSDEGEVEVDDEFDVEPRPEAESSDDADARASDAGTAGEDDGGDHDRRG